MRQSVLALGVLSLMTTPLAAQETWKIGALYPLTGNLALLGNENLNGAQIAVDVVNEAGGIGGKKVELVTGDASTPDKAQAEAERLLSSAGVQVITGTYSSGLSYAASQVAERRGAIYWETGGIADGLTKREFKNFFRVVFTRFVLDPSGNDIGVYGRKRELLASPHWCLDGTPGAELLPELAAGPDDFVIVKKKPSAFFGTPLLSLLVDRGIDTVIVCGGATSNCVRATVFDASSYNFRTIVAEEAVMDRIPVSHAIALFDMDRQFADIVKCDDIVAYLENLGGEE